MFDCSLGVCLRYIAPTVCFRCISSGKPSNQMSDISSSFRQHAMRPAAFLSSLCCNKRTASSPNPWAGQYHFSEWPFSDWVTCVISPALRCWAQPAKRVHRLQVEKGKSNRTAIGSITTYFGRANLNSSQLLHPKIVRAIAFAKRI